MGMIPEVELPKVDTSDKRTRTEEKYPIPLMVKALSIARLMDSPTQASEATGIPRQTIDNWLKGILPLSLKDNEVIRFYTDKELGDLRFLRNESLQQVFNKLPSASAAQAATVYGILTDKMMAMERMSGNFTQNTFIFSGDMSAEDKLDLIEKVAKRGMAQREQTNRIANDEATIIDIEDVTDE